MERLFIALPIPIALKDSVRNLPRTLQGRWLHEDDLHITLRFLGEIEVEKQATIKTALTAVKRPPFFIEADGLNCFHHKDQSILYINIASTKKLTTLCADITDRLTPLGFDFGTRPYIPHVTLARLKKGIKNCDHYTKKNSRQIKTSWQALSFCLMHSGPADEQDCRYQIIENYPLL